MNQINDKIWKCSEVKEKFELNNQGDEVEQNLYPFVCKKCGGKGLLDHEHGDGYLYCGLCRNAVWIMDLFYDSGVEYLPWFGDEP